MSADAWREFVDTNVLIYAFDTSAGPKKAASEQLISKLWTTGTGCLSVQVLQEFFVTVTRKVARPLTIEEASDCLRDLSAWTVFAPNADDVVRAIALQQQAHVGFWDAMIVHAAAELGCDVLWTEDLNAGQVIQGVSIRNPFATSSSRR